MDPVTQGLLGAAAVQVGLRQRIGSSASWVAFAAAVSPDLDILIAPALRWLGDGSPMDRLIFHRGLTHSLVMIPVIALAFALPWWAIRRRLLRRRSAVAHAPPAGFGWLFACCFVAVATHGLLDCCTSYGTQLLWPFSTARIAWDCVPIVDIIYTPLLALTLLACYVLRKIFRARPARAARVTVWVGVLGLVLSTGYIVAGRFCHGLALYRGQEAVGDQQIVKADAYPMLGTIFLWRVVIETPDRWYVVREHLLGNSQRDGDVQSAVKPSSQDMWVRQARKCREYEVFAWFSGGRVRAAVQPCPVGAIVDFHDMRYSWTTSGTESLWSLRVVLDGRGRIEQVGFTHPIGRHDRRQIFTRFWRDVMNP